jgi:hypothetical protein
MYRIGRARWHDQDGVRCIAPALTSGSRLKIAFEPSIDTAGGVLITAVGRRRSTDFGRPVTRCHRSEMRACGDAAVEREAVPGEPATWKQRHGNPLEGAAPVRPGW